MDSWPEQDLVIAWHDKHQLCLPVSAIKDLAEQLTRLNIYGKNIGDYETLEFLYFTFKKLQDKTQSECVMDERRAFKAAIRNYVR